MTMIAPNLSDEEIERKLGRGAVIGLNCWRPSRRPKWGYNAGGGGLYESVSRIMRKVNQQDEIPASVWRIRRGPRWWRKRTGGMIGQAPRLRGRTWSRLKAKAVQFLSKEHAELTAALYPGSVVVEGPLEENQES